MSAEFRLASVEVASNVLSSRNNSAATAEFATCSPHLSSNPGASMGRLRSRSANFGAEPSRFGRARPISAEFGPESGKLGRSTGRFGQSSAKLLMDFGRCRLSSARHRATRLALDRCCAEFGPSSATTGVTSNRFGPSRPSLDRCLAELSRKRTKGLPHLGRVNLGSRCLRWRQFCESAPTIRQIRKNSVAISMTLVESGEVGRNRSNLVQPTHIGKNVGQFRPSSANRADQDGVPPFSNTVPPKSARAQQVRPCSADARWSATNVGRIWPGEDQKRPESDKHLDCSRRNWVPLWPNRKPLWEAEQHLLRSVD